MINPSLPRHESRDGLLNHSAMMVDAAYDELYRAMKPGMSENQAVGLVSKVLYDMGSEYVEAVNAISGERCNPHPHVFSDRVLRPGDPVYYDILHSYMGYRTCYYRCFTIGYASHAMNDAYKRCREYLDAAIELVRPGRTTAEIAAVWPKAQEFGFPNEEAAFALQYGHGIGLAIWEKPVISRLVSLEHSCEIKPGMVFALETFWHRGRNCGNRDRSRSDHAISGGRITGRRPALCDGGRAAARAPRYSSETQFAGARDDRSELAERTGRRRRLENASHPLRVLCSRVGFDGPMDQRILLVLNSILCNRFQILTSTSKIWRSVS